MTDEAMSPLRRRIVWTSYRRILRPVSCMAETISARLLGDLIVASAEKGAVRFTVQSTPRRSQGDGQRLSGPDRNKETEQPLSAPPRYPSARSETVYSPARA